MFTTALPDHIVRLREIDLFANCTVRELRRIDGLATSATVASGRVLCRRGEIGRECFVLLDGHADIDVDGHHYTVGRGALVGEIALLTQGGRRIATVTALTDITVLTFTRTEFTQLMTAIPSTAHKILRAATQRLVEDIEPAGHIGATIPSAAGHDVQL